MSRKGNCYDNAAMESFGSPLKLELVYRRFFHTRSQARTQIFDYIEAFYNRQRLHSQGRRIKILKPRRADGSKLFVFKGNRRGTTEAQITQRRQGLEETLLI